MTFGDKLLNERKKSNLSAQDLAQACDLSRSYITLMENNKRLPGKKVLPKIAQALDLDTDTLVEWYLEDLREKLA